MNTEEQLRARVAALEERVNYLEGVHRYTMDALQLAASLGDFQKSFSTAETPAVILRETCARVQQLISFQWVAIFLFSEEDGSLRLAYREPATHDAEIEQQLEHLIEDRTLAWSLDRRQPVFIGPTAGGAHLLLHCIATASRIRGVFLGLLKENVFDIPDSFSFLLPLVMLHSANSLESFELYQMIKTVNKDLERELNRRMLSEEALKDAHGQLRSIFDAAPVAIKFLDRNYQLVDVSEKLLAQFGHKTRAQVVGKKCYDVFRKRRDPCPDCLVPRVIATGRTLSGVFSPDSGDSPEKRHDKIYCAPVRDADGQIRGVAVFVVDITDLKHMEKALEAARDEAEAASRAKSSFLANMSHEIRTPMNAITGMADMALLSGLTDEQRDYIETIKQSAQHLLQLINDILDFSKIEARMLRIESGDFDLQELLRTVLKALSPEAEKKRIRLSLNCANGLPVRIKGDSVRLRQILYNLIGNALKFTFQGQVAVSASLLAPSQNGRRCVLFSVRDTGIGIPYEKQELVFKEFTQIRGALGGRSGGTGLGLAICRLLVSLMDGAIWLESEPGTGSTFFFTIPYEPALLLAGQQTARPRPDALAGALRILLVEDNATNAKVAMLLLQRLGHHPRHAANGLEALQLLREERYDVVLMDLEMPGMDGLAAAKAVRRGEAGQENRSVRIMAMTAHAVSGYAQRCREAGMDGFLTKPIDFISLRSELGEGPGWGNSNAAPEQRGGADLPLLNTSSALERLDGETAILKTLLKTFVGDLPRQLVEILLAAKTEDCGLLCMHAHALKGSCSTIGAESCAYLSEQLEKAACARQKVLFPGLLRKLEAEVARLLDALKNA